MDQPARRVAYGSLNSECRCLKLVDTFRGGCLYNFRGLTKHSTDQDFSEAYNLSYYLSPIAGAISGLLVFFLLMGGALTLSIGTNEEA